MNEDLFTESYFAKNRERVQKHFFNKVQRRAMAINAHDEYIVAARGVGKSEGLDARFIIRNVWEMPGSTGALISPTYAKAWGNTLPAICHALKCWGYIEGVHYFVGRKAPSSMGFGTPKRTPLREAWSNCFHFWNGTVMVVLSFAQGMSANSMSLDWILGSEAKFLDYDKIKHEVNAANRGNIQYFGDCPWHHSVMYTTDMPTTGRGKWILDKQEECSPEHIDFLRNIYRQKKEMEMREPTSYTERVIRELTSDLALARKYQRPVKPKPGKTREYTVYYDEYDVFDNLEVLGKDFIWQMYRDSPPLVWQTAFLNKRIFRNPNGFYSGLNDAHFYMPADSSRLPEIGQRGSLLKLGCLADGDLDMSLPINIAFDANAAISSCVVSQVQNKTERILKSFFVKTPLKLPDLVQKVADYYHLKINHDINFYYDHTFVWKNATSSESYSDTIKKIFITNGYRVREHYIGQAPLHSWKHAEIDKALKGDPQYLLPQFNEPNNEFLRIALEQTGIKQGKNGFEKDKTPEGTPDSPDNPDEYKTHITDAFDTLWLGDNFYYRKSMDSDEVPIFLGKKG